MASLFNESAAIEHQDAVASRSVDSRWAIAVVVRPRVEGLERLLNRLLALGVDAAGRFVEHQDRRIVQNRPGDGGRCRSPPEGRAALAEQVSYPSGELRMNSCDWAAFAAAIACSAVLVGKP